MTTPEERVRLQVPSPEVNLPSSIALSFCSRALSFPGIALLFSRSAFDFLKMLYCFRKLPFSMPKVTIILDDLKTSTRSMILYVFYWNFSLYDSLENTVSEHLEWLKSQKKFYSPQTPVWQAAVYSGPLAVSHCCRQENKVALNWKYNALFNLCGPGLSSRIGLGTGSNSACSISQICDGQNLQQCSKL